MGLKSEIPELTDPRLKIEQNTHTINVQPELCGAKIGNLRIEHTVENCPEYGVSYSELCGAKTGNF